MTGVQTCALPIYIITREYVNDLAFIIKEQNLKIKTFQLSAESKVTPGGYEETDEHNKHMDRQFSLNDRRSLDEIALSLLGQGYIPSFCVACYRKNRTGENFMELAKPGQIKNMCDINALITLKEYLEDFAKPEVKEAGYKLIEEYKKTLDNKSLRLLEKFFKNIDGGIRDEYI